MKTALSYILAFLACVLELFLYGFIVAYFKLEPKGFISILILVIVFTIMKFTWSAIRSAFKKKK